MRFLTDLKTVPPMALFLGSFGLLPFLAGGVGVWLDGLGDLQYALPMLVLIYGAIITSFLGGVRWGAAMQNGATQEQTRYLIISIVPSLLAFIALTLPLASGLVLLTIVFLSQALIDILAVKAGHLAAWFAPLRLLLSAGVCVSFVSMLVEMLIR
jgi:hypothetical protein